MWTMCISILVLKFFVIFLIVACWNFEPQWGLSWLFLYGSWIYNYLCNHCRSPLTLWVQILLRRGVLDTTLCDKVCQWLATGWFSPVYSTNKTDRHDVTEILLQVALNTITLTLQPQCSHTINTTTKLALKLIWISPHKRVSKNNIIKYISWKYKISLHILVCLSL